MSEELPPLTPLRFDLDHYDHANDLRHRLRCELIDVARVVAHVGWNTATERERLEALKEPLRELGEAVERYETLDQLLAVGEAKSDAESPG